MMTRKSRSKQNKIQKRLKQINQRERERLGASAVVNTRSFRGRQKFGPASGVVHISPEEYREMSGEQMG